ncbi:MAG: aminotransferase class I/II-fold pyridoxal phosphate-dependent enzyme [Anaerolineales bacterium]
MTQPATRMQTIPPYFFAELGKRIARLRADGHDVIRMDMGSPDMPPAPHIIEALVNSARDPSNHGYAPFGGTPSFCQAVADHYQRRFDVELDAENEVVGLIGSKEGLFNIVQSHVNPGEVVLVPDPGYPVYTTSARFAGGEVYHLPLIAENDFLPDLDSIPPSALERAKLMWLNYPNNPTGAVADLDYFAKAIEFARAHDILLCHDAPYTEVCFDEYLAPSLMQVDGAKDVAVEFNSLSKSHNMAGWRVGMAVGNERAIRALYTLKSQIDTSQFRSIFDAGVTALEGDQSWLVERNAIYQLRRDMILEAIGQAGMSADTPRAALYVWASLPEGVISSMDYCSRMLEEIHVSITPGVAFGDAGEGYVRLSLSSPTEKVEQAMARVAEWKY